MILNGVKVSECQCVKKQSIHTGIPKALFCWVLLSILCTPVRAQVVSSTELIEQAKDYDNKEVTYLGEAIGEVMVRRDHAWINVNDGKAAIGVWCKKEMAEQIKFTGSYDFSGDQVLVTGIFHRSCTEHGGAIDIHARNLRILTRGERIFHPVSPGKRKLGITLAIPAAILALYYFVRRRKQ